MDANRDELLAAIAANPEAIENWLVYADWLSERGDVRGELITLELAIEAKLANPEAIERHRVLMRDEDALLSPRLVEQAHHLNFEFWRGFIRGASVFGPADDPPTREVLEALYADPHACVLRKLELGPHVELCSTPNASVRELDLLVRTRCELPLESRFPMLESCDLAVASEYGDGVGPERLEHMRLKRLSLRGSCEALATGRFALPNLERLDLDVDPRELLEVGGILAAPPPRLETITMGLWTACVRELRASPLLAQLRSLEMGINEEALDEIARDPTPFRRIDLTTFPYAETIEQRDALWARIRAVLPNARPENSAFDDEPEPEPVATPTALAPDVAAKIDSAFKRLADRMRNR